MKIIIGLGNPGKEYQNTRHNAGFMFVDGMAKSANLTFGASTDKDCLVARSASLLILKPQLFMNKSGEAVRHYLSYYKLLDSLDRSSIVVAHDDLDLRLGSYKLQFAKGPKVHNGLSSLYSHLGGSEFWHMRLGVDNRQPDQRIPGGDYVLAPFQAEEQPIFQTELTEALAQLQSTPLVANS